MNVTNVEKLSTGSHILENIGTLNTGDKPYENGQVYFHVTPQRTSEKSRRGKVWECMTCEKKWFISYAYGEPQINEMQTPKR